MDIEYELRGIPFRWNADKAKRNLAKHTKGLVMKMATLKKRLAKSRPMVSVTLRMPEDVVTDLKRVAPLRGFSGYQSLMRAYVGAGLREDMERFEASAMARLVERLRDDGVPTATLDKALAEINRLAA